MLERKPTTFETLKGSLMKLFEILKNFVLEGKPSQKDIIKDILNEGGTKIKLNELPDCVRKAFNDIAKEIEEDIQRKQFMSDDYYVSKVYEIIKKDGSKIYHAIIDGDGSGVSVYGAADFMAFHAQCVFDGEDVISSSYEECGYFF